MAPLIRYFPSYRFYHDRLIDSDTVIKRELPDFLLCFHNKNVIFIDIKYGRDEKRGDSQINHAEGEAIGLLVKCLLDPNISMGVITPYQAQRKIIKNEAFRELKANAEEVQLFEKNIMINTVDSFQGQERDIILVSTVRANNRKQLGFLTD
jgi:senataxin